MERLTLLAAAALENNRLLSDLQRQMEQLKQAQVQIVQSAKLAAIGELAAGVAHELNNPLTAVLGFTELLEEHECLDAAAREDLAMVESEARRARDIVRNLLDFSRQSKPQRRSTDLNRILQQTLAIIRYHLKKRDIQIQEHYDPDLGLIPADEGQMKQIFLNLITNALQAMPQGGQLTLRTARVGDEVVASVSDTGSGISRDDMERIFDPFFSTKPSARGLGLPVSLGIVQEHQGRITVESEASRGSTFSVWLPVKDLPDDQRP